MSRLSKRHFWNWFQRNNHEYLDLKKKSQKEQMYWMHELDAHLRAHTKRLSFTLGLSDNNTATLTVSANGEPNKFKKVEAFIGMAPEISGWTMRALDDPMPIDFLLEKQMLQTGVDPRELLFSIIHLDNEKPIIMVYHPLCSEDNEHLFMQLAEGAIYNLLGERSFALDIATIMVQNLSDAADQDLQGLEELPQSLGMEEISAEDIPLNGASFVVDSQGRLVISS